MTVPTLQLNKLFILTCPFIYSTSIIETTNIVTSVTVLQSGIVCTYVYGRRRMTKMLDAAFDKNPHMTLTVTKFYIFMSLVRRLYVLLLKPYNVYEIKTI